MDNPYCSLRNHLVNLFKGHLHHGWLRLRSRYGRHCANATAAIPQHHVVSRHLEVVRWPSRVIDWGFGRGEPALRWWGLALSSVCIRFAMDEDWRFAVCWQHSNQQERSSRPREEGSYRINDRLVRDYRRLGSTGPSHLGSFLIQSSAGRALIPSSQRDLESKARQALYSATQKPQHRIFSFHNIGIP